MVQLFLLENYISTTSYESIANNLPQRSKQQSSVSRNNLINIPVVNNSFLNISNSHEPINADHNAHRKSRNQRQYDIPVFISTNVRKLDNNWNWIAGGGVCMYIHESIPCKQLVDCIEEPVEALWILLRPQKLPRNVTCIIAVVVYHTTSNREPENLKLKDHIQRNLDNLLRKYPNALIVITGDFNPNSTGLKHTYLTSPNNLKQLVTFNTRESNILDWFLTNRIKQFTIHQLPKIASSDHYTILAKPISINTNDKENKKVKRRDMKDSNWRAFGRWMTTKDWTAVLQKTTCEDKFQLFLSELKEGIDFYLPEKTVIIHQNDRPWMTKELKSMIKRKANSLH